MTGDIEVRLCRVFDKETVWPCKAESDRVIIDLLDDDRFIFAFQPRRHGWRQFFIHQHIFIPEDDVVGG